MKFATLEQLSKLILVHYGDTRWDPDKFQPVRNDWWIKPFGGLWTSPWRSRHSWRSWCIASNFRTRSLRQRFFIKLSEQSRVLLIDSPEDTCSLEGEPALPGLKTFHRINFQKLSKRYDAIWLTERGEQSTRWLLPREAADGLISLYGWDCESVLIMNPNIVIPISSPQKHTLCSDG